jgi:hypothetical protein
MSGVGPQELAPDALDAFDLRLWVYDQLATHLPNCEGNEVHKGNKGNESNESNTSNEGKVGNEGNGGNGDLGCMISSPRNFQIVNFCGIMAEIWRNVGVYSWWW